MLRRGTALLFVLAIGSPLSGGTNQWTRVGPPLAATAIAADAHDPDLLYAAGWDAIAKSSDRGASWTVTPLPGVQPRVLRIAFSAPATLYVLGFGTLHRSTSGGDTWTQRRVPRTAQFQNDLEVHPTASNHLCVAAANFCFLGCTGGGVYRSTDGGDSWHAAGLDDADVTDVALDPFQTSVLYAISESRLFRTIDGGRSWRDISPAAEVASIAVDAVVASTIYAGGTGGVFRSGDRGESWTLVRASDFQPRVMTGAFPSRELFAAAGGLVISADQGRTWSELPTRDSGLEFLRLWQLDMSRETYYMVVDVRNAPGQILAFEIRNPRRRALRH